MRIYISHASAFNYKEKLYAPLRASQLNLDHELILPHEKSSRPEDFPTRELLMTSVDLVIVEASLPATGSGIELGWADSKDVPIYAIFEEGSKPSSSVLMVAKTSACYKDSTDMIQKIEAFIASNQ